MAAWLLLRETASRYSGHKASLLGAALAYYSVFSLGPLMVIAIAIAGLVFGDDAARGEVGTQLKDLLQRPDCSLGGRIHPGV
jgi:membrane protein